MIPGLELRYALAIIHSVLGEGRTDAELDGLDRRLGIDDLEDDVETEDGYRVVEVADDPRLAPEVPTAAHDPAAMAALAQFGEQVLV